MPTNQTKDEGNDDQVYWAFAAMSAAENGFPAPPSTNPSWLAMAQAVFNEQAARWDTSTCGGGLRWQIFTFNSGYTYKNVPSNGGFMNLAARLARYTGNATYTEWAEKSWNWLADSVLYDNKTFSIWDGTSDVANCTDAEHIFWSYNYGAILSGLANLYNLTEDASYLPAINGILDACFTNFFPEKYGNKIMVEAACQPLGTCDTDQYAFKGITIRMLVVVSQLVPSTAATIWPYIQASAQGAAGQCIGGADGKTCGFEWNSTTYDGLYGVGEQLSALAVIGANMVNIDNSLKAPLTSNTGGTSKSNPSAGTSTNTDSLLPSIVTKKMTTADKAGAAIVTILVLGGTLAGAAWMVLFD